MPPAYNRFGLMDHRDCYNYRRSDFMRQAVQFPHYCVVNRLVTGARVLGSSVNGALNLELMTSSSKANSRGSLLLQLPGKTRDDILWKSYFVINWRHRAPDLFSLADSYCSIGTGLEIFLGPIRMDAPNR